MRLSVAKAVFPLESSAFELEVKEKLGEVVPVYENPLRPMITPYVKTALRSTTREVQLPLLAIACPISI